jgi:peptidoglycan biosynthesis protein MviN/MurJ (putative lipid II flippase)
VLAETTGLVVLSVLSPAAGLAVEMALAWRFGISPVVDAYRVAVLLVLFGQQLFVTSILPFVIVPVFAEYQAQGKEQEAWASVDSLAHLLLVFGALIAFLLFLFPSFATSLLAPGLIGEGRSAAVFFVRWCGLAFIPLCWSGVACGILYAHQVFRIAPLSQLVANLALLTAILVGGAKLGSASVVLGVLVGAVGSASLYAARLAQLRRQFAPGRRARGIDILALRKLFRLARMSWSDTSSGTSASSVFCPGSPAYGRSVGATISIISTIGCVWTWNTSRSGRCGWTARSWRRRRGLC